MMDRGTRLRNIQSQNQSGRRAEVKYGSRPRTVGGGRHCLRTVGGGRHCLRTVGGGRHCLRTVGGGRHCLRTVVRDVLPENICEGYIA